MIPNFGLIMLFAMIAIGTGVFVEISNNKKKKWDHEWVKACDYMKKASIALILFVVVFAGILHVNNDIDLFRTRWHYAGRGNKSMGLLCFLRGRIIRWFLYHYIQWCGNYFKYGSVVVPKSERLWYRCPPTRRRWNGTQDRHSCWRRKYIIPSKKRSHLYCRLSCWCRRKHRDCCNGIRRRKSGHIFLNIKQTREQSLVSSSSAYFCANQRIFRYSLPYRAGIRGCHTPSIQAAFKRRDKMLCLLARQKPFPPPINSRLQK